MKPDSENHRGRPATKRWFYITAVQLSPHGGQTTHIMESCRALAHRRPTTLLAPAPPPEPIPQLSFLQVPLPLHPPRELRFQVRIVRAMSLLARSHRPDVVYVRASSFNLGGILLARLLHIPCVLEINGLPALEYGLSHPGPQARLRALAYTLMNHLEWPLASGIVGVTEFLGREAERAGSRAVLVASNGVNPSRFVPGDMQAARQRLGLPAQAEVVGFAGNFTAWQGLDTLIEAAKLLVPHRPSLHVVLVGGGSEHKRLEQMAAPIRDHVHFLGFQPHGEVGNLLAACDILVGTFAPIERNRRGGLSPLKVFEYLALGRAIVCSRQPGLEFIEQQQVGSLFDPGDAASLATHLAAILDMPTEERQRMARRARHLAEHDYSWERITERIIAFAEGLCETSRQGTGQS